MLHIFYIKEPPFFVLSFQMKAFMMKQNERGDALIQVISEVFFVG